MKYRLKQVAHPKLTSNGELAGSPCMNLEMSG